MNNNAKSRFKALTKSNRRSQAQAGKNMWNGKPKVAGSGLVKNKLKE